MNTLFKYHPIIQNNLDKNISAFQALTEGNSQDGKPIYLEVKGNKVRVTHKPEKSANFYEVNKFVGDLLEKSNYTHEELFILRKYYVLMKQGEEMGINEEKKLLSLDENTLVIDKTLRVIENKFQKQEEQISKVEDNFFKSMSKTRIMEHRLRKTLDFVQNQDLIFLEKLILLNDKIKSKGIKNKDYPRYEKLEPIIKKLIKNKPLNKSEKELVNWISQIQDKRVRFEPVIQVKVKTESFSQIKKTRQLNLKDLKNSYSLTEEKIAKAFEHDFGIRFKSISKEDRAIVDWTSHLFEEVLFDVSKKVQNGEISQEQAPSRFKQLFTRKVKEKNQITEKLDKDTFRILAGKWLEGHSKLPLGQKIKLPQNNFEVRKAVEDYKSGQWKDGEERIFEYTMVPGYKSARYEHALDFLLEEEPLSETLNNFFHQVAK